MMRRKISVCVGKDKIHIMVGHVKETNPKELKIIKLLREYGASEVEIINFMNDLSSMKDVMDDNEDYN